MRKLLLILIIFVQNSYAEDDLKQIFLSFESAYMSNDVSKFKPLPAKKYKFSQTLHIPGGISDTRPVSKRQLLNSMRATKMANTMPRSNPENTSIRVLENGEFCGESNTINEVLVSGKKQEEKEVRSVCFKKTKKGYLAFSHKIDVYYAEL